MASISGSSSFSLPSLSGLFSVSSSATDEARPSSPTESIDTFLPAVEDFIGYPLPPELKEALQAETLLFPSTSDLKQHGEDMKVKDGALFPHPAATRAFEQFIQRIEGASDDSPLKTLATLVKSRVMLDWSAVMKVGNGPVYEDAPYAFFRDTDIDEEGKISTTVVNGKTGKIVSFEGNPFTDPSGMEFYETARQRFIERNGLPSRMTVYLVERGLLHQWKKATFPIKSDIETLLCDAIDSGAVEFTSLENKHSKELIFTFVADTGEFSLSIDLENHRDAPVFSHHTQLALETFANDFMQTPVIPPKLEPDSLTEWECIMSYFDLTQEWEKLKREDKKDLAPRLMCALEPWILHMHKLGTALLEGEEDEAAGNIRNLMKKKVYQEIMAVFPEHVIPERFYKPANLLHLWLGITRNTLSAFASPEIRGFISAITYASTHEVSEKLLSAFIEGEQRIAQDHSSKLLPVSSEQLHESLATIRTRALAIIDHPSIFWEERAASQAYAWLVSCPLSHLEHIEAFIKDKAIPNSSIHLGILPNIAKHWINSGLFAQFYSILPKFISPRFSYENWFKLCAQLPQKKDFSLDPIIADVQFLAEEGYSPEFFFKVILQGAQLAAEGEVSLRELVQGSGLKGLKYIYTAINYYLKIQTNPALFRNHIARRVLSKTDSGLDSPAMKMLSGPLAVRMDALTFDEALKKIQALPSSLKDALSSEHTALSRLPETRQAIFTTQSIEQYLEDFGVGFFFEAIRNPEKFYRYVALSALLSTYDVSLKDRLPLEDLEAITFDYQFENALNTLASLSPQKSPQPANIFIKATKIVASIFRTPSLDVKTTDFITKLCTQCDAKTVLDILSRESFATIDAKALQDIQIATQRAQKHLPEESDILALQGMLIGNFDRDKLREALAFVAFFNNTFFPLDPRATRTFLGESRCLDSSKGSALMKQYKAVSKRDRLLYFSEEDMGSFLNALEGMRTQQNTSELATDNLRSVLTTISGIVQVYQCAFDLLRVHAMFAYCEGRPPWELDSTLTPLPLSNNPLCPLCAYRWKDGKFFFYIIHPGKCEITSVQIDIPDAVKAYFSKTKNMTTEVSIVIGNNTIRRPKKVTNIVLDFLEGEFVYEPTSPLHAIGAREESSVETIALSLLQERSLIDEWELATQDLSDADKTTILRFPIRVKNEIHIAMRSALSPSTIKKQPHELIDQLSAVFPTIFPQHVLSFVSLADNLWLDAIQKPTLLAKLPLLAEIARTPEYFPYGDLERIVQCPLKAFAVLPPEEFDVYIDMHTFLQELEAFAQYPLHPEMKTAFFQAAHYFKPGLFSMPRRLEELRSDLQKTIRSFILPPRLVANMDKAQSDSMSYLELPGSTKASSLRNALEKQKIRLPVIIEFALLTGAQFTLNCYLPKEVVVTHTTETKSPTFVFDHDRESHSHNAHWLISYTGLMTCLSWEVSDDVFDAGEEKKFTLKIHVTNIAKKTSLTRLFSLLLPPKLLSELAKIGKALLDEKIPTLPGIGTYNSIREGLLRHIKAVQMAKKFLSRAPISDAIDPLTIITWLTNVEFPSIEDAKVKLAQALNLFADWAKTPEQKAVCLDFLLKFSGCSAHELSETNKANIFDFIHALKPLYRQMCARLATTTPSEIPEDLPPGSNDITCRNGGLQLADPHFDSSLDEQSVRFIDNKAAQVIERLAPNKPITEKFLHLKFNGFYYPVLLSVSIKSDFIENQKWALQLTTNVGGQSITSEPSYFLFDVNYTQPHLQKEAIALLLARELLLLMREVKQAAPTEEGANTTPPELKRGDPVVEITAEESDPLSDPPPEPVPQRRSRRAHTEGVTPQTPPPKHKRGKSHKRNKSIGTFLAFAPMDDTPPDAAKTPEETLEATPQRRPRADGAPPPPLRPAFKSPDTATRRRSVRFADDEDE